MLQYIVGLISQYSQLLLEIVNLNVRGQQYVCTGHVSNPPYALKPLIDVQIVTKPPLSIRDP